MRKHCFFGLWLLLTPLLSHATPLEGLRFSHHDWELACDNTGTCRAAGYHDENTDSGGVSVLLTREAGQNTTTTGQLKLGFYEEGGHENAVDLTMIVDGKILGKLEHQDESYSLSKIQVAVLIKALSRVSTITFRDNQQQKWQLSDRGGAAVLLKMDEFQKRLGTAGALIRKGALGETNVLKPRPAPVIKVPTLLANKTMAPVEKTKAIQALQQFLERGDRDICSFAQERGLDSLKVFPFNQQHSLVSTVCWRGAYNEGLGFWLISADLEQIHQLITEDASDYENGEIYGSHKGRGLGDCWGGSSWAWNGQAFVLAGEYTTGMCRMIEVGGAWRLPTKVSNIQRP